MIVVVLGAGAWGTAVAVHAARRHEVRLWTRSAEHAEAMRGARRNERYLPGTELPAALSVTADLDQALAGVTARNGLLVLAGYRLGDSVAHMERELRVIAIGGSVLVFVVLLLLYRRMFARLFQMTKGDAKPPTDAS